MMHRTANNKKALANITSLAFKPDVPLVQQANKTLPKLGLLGMVISVLSACTAIPPKADHSTVIAEPHILLNQAYKTGDIATISTLKQPNIAAKRWQNFYSDIKLKKLISIALQNNKDLEAALLTIQLAKAQYQISDNKTLPTVGANGGYTRSATHPVDKNPSSGYNVGLGMSSYEIDLWGRIASLKEQSLQNYLSSTAGKDAAQIAIISNIAQTYVNLSYAKAQYKLAKSTVESRKKSLFITKKRFEAGVDSKSPSLQASSSLESAKSAMYQAETSILKLENALQLLIGAPVPTDLMPSPGVTDIANKKIFNAGLPSQLLHYRPDILQAEYTLKAAGANIDAARAAYFPSITLTGRLGFSSSHITDLFNHNKAMGWSFGPSVNVPIFDAGNLDANYEVAQVQRQQALARYEKSIQTAFREVSDVLADRATMQKRLASQYKQQDSLNQTYIIALARYKSGLSDYLSVLDAERTQFGIQQGILSLEQAKIISQIQLYQVLGGGVEMDVPVQLSVPNNPELVEFIATHADTVNNTEDVIVDTIGKRTLSSTNVARTTSTSRLATIADYKEKLTINSETKDKISDDSSKKLVTPSEDTDINVFDKTKERKQEDIAEDATTSGNADNKVDKSSKKDK